MSDNGNGNGNGKKKRGINWSGMAAFITAIAGVVAMFLVQDKKGTEQDMVQESAFVIMNARVDKLEERIMHIERMLMHDYAMATVVSSPKPPKLECESDDDCDEYSICQESMCVPEPTPGEDGDGVVDVLEPVVRPSPKPEPNRRDRMIEKYTDYKEIKEHVQMEQKPVRLD